MTPAWFKPYGRRMIRMHPYYAPAYFKRSARRFPSDNDLDLHDGDLEEHGNVIVCGITSNSDSSPSLKSQFCTCEEIVQPTLANEDIVRQHDVTDPETTGSHMTRNKFMALVAMAFLWTSAQIPLYLFGAIPPYIYGDIGGADSWVWCITGNLLASAATCPFVGALSDLLGRRQVALLGCAFIIVGQCLCSGSNSIDCFIAGMTISGVGSGINELTALAGTSELAPTSKRGVYISWMILTIVPFMPSVMYAQLIAAYSSWRLVGVITAGWACAGLLTTAFFYFPPPRVNSLGLSKRDILKRVDWMGGLLSILGITLFVYALMLGCYPYDWTDPKVLVLLVVGILSIAAFVCWEIWRAEYPIVPRRLGKAPRTLILTLVITFISGTNFFSVLMMWPGQSYNVYGHNPVEVGWRGLPFSLGVLSGCVLALSCLSRKQGRGRKLLLCASCVMAAGCGAMAAAHRDNLHLVLFFLFIAGLGVGGIVVPASIVAQVICPDELIATITSLSMAIRVIGGAVGYALYDSIFKVKLAEKMGEHLVPVAIESGLRAEDVSKAVEFTVTSLLPLLRGVQGVTPETFDKLVFAGQIAYSEAYPYVYYCSIGFGVISTVASLFVGDISQFMDDHVAVVVD